MLIISAYNGRLAVVQLLLGASGIHVCFRDGDGKTAEEWAAARGHTAVQELLGRGC